LENEKMARVVKFAVQEDLADTIARIKESVNGTLEHELSVGDSAYIPIAAKIVVPYNPRLQMIYSLSMGMSQAHAFYLAVARWGLQSYWGNYLISVDIDEMVQVNQFDGIFTVATVDENTTITVKHNAPGNISKKEYVVTVPTAVLDVDFGALQNYVIDNTVRADLLFLHMKDIGLLVAANLVKTGHHYQSLTNGAFKAIERKRFGAEKFNNDVRGVIYHDAIHCFTQLVKLRIYMDVLPMVKAGKFDGLYELMDPVVKKRLPVVPAGAAWLSAGLTVMNELLAIPKISAKIPTSYIEVVEDARKVLKEAMETARVDTNTISKFEALAAYAFGVLSEIAPTHSAANAPSLKKIADIHLGAKTAGSELGRASLRGEL